MTRTECRSCGDTKPCQEGTLHARERNTNGQDWTSTTGQCDDCLDEYGPDDYCNPPEEDPRTAAEVNGETELELMREWGDF